MRVTSRPTRPVSPFVSAAGLLGSDHPLARAADRRSWLRRQLAGVGLVLLSAVAAQLTGLAAARSLITAAGMVETALAFSLLLVAKDERRLARELIIAGRDSLPLPAIARERQRLLDPSHRHRLARSLERIIEAPGCRRWLLRSSRPLFRVHVIAAVSPELTELVRALRRTDCEAAGIAMTHRLLCDGDSPLYGDDIARLRETLRRVRARLDG